MNDITNDLAAVTGGFRPGPGTKLLVKTGVAAAANLVIGVATGLGIGTAAYVVDEPYHSHKQGSKP